MIDLHHDEEYLQCVREDLIEEGLDNDSIDVIIDELRDSSHFILDVSRHTPLNNKS